MSTTYTVILGIVAMLLPLLIGRTIWRSFDRWFSHPDTNDQDSLKHFLKKIACTVLASFISLWLGISLVFNSNGS